MNPLLEKLEDAYALERQALRSLESALGQSTACSRTRLKLREQAAGTKWQARLLEVCLENLGTKPGLRRKSRKYPPSNDTSVYHSLIAAAKHAGETEIVQICHEIIDRKLAMSAGLEELLPAQQAASQAGFQWGYSTNLRTDTGKAANTFDG
ncbi:MAG: DUF892 family protein [Alphaproteobacteria bacterium]